MDYLYCYRYQGVLTNRASRLGDLLGWDTIFFWPLFSCDLDDRLGNYGISNGFRTLTLANSLFWQILTPLVSLWCMTLGCNSTCI